MMSHLADRNRGLCVCFMPIVVKWLLSDVKIPPTPPKKKKKKKKTRKKNEKKQKKNNNKKNNCCN